MNSQVELTVSQDHHVLFCSTDHNYNITALLQIKCTSFILANFIYLWEIFPMTLGNICVSGIWLSYSNSLTFSFIYCMFFFGVSHKLDFLAQKRTHIITKLVIQISKKYYSNNDMELESFLCTFYDQLLDYISY